MIKLKCKHDTGWFNADGTKSMDKKLSDELEKISRLPGHFTLNDFEVTPGNKEAYEYSKYYPYDKPFLDENENELNPDWKPFLVLLGDTGTGKTHIALSITWRRVSDTVDYDFKSAESDIIDYRCSIYYQVADLMTCLKRGMKDDSYFEIMDYCKECGLLVLDDIGTQKDSEWTESILDEIIDYRYVRSKDTIITSNESSFSPRIASRLSDKTMCRIIKITGGDYRLRKGGKK
jgi:DNA replication protein DnaC